MGRIFTSSNPILLLIAVILAFIAAYTALDLLTMVQTSRRNKRFLFMGCAFSMGIAIWTLNFLGMLAFDPGGSFSYNLSITIFSMAAAIILAGAGIAAVSSENVTFRGILVCSAFLAAAMAAGFLGALYALHEEWHVRTWLFIICLLFIFILYVFAFMILFYSSHQNKTVQYWHKPFAAVIITGSIVEGHLLLARAFSADHPLLSPLGLVQDAPFLIYLLFLIATIIVAGLIASSTIISKRLDRSDQYLKDILSALDQSSIVAITDETGRITYANEKFAELSKYSQSELIGKNHSLINAGYHSKEFFQELWNEISSGRTWKGEICNKAKDNTIYWVDTTIVPFMKSGRPYQYVSIRSDITERKRVEEELKSSLQEVNDIYYALDQSAIVVFTDEKGVITNVNQRFCDITRYKRNELIGRNLALINSGVHPPEFFESLWTDIQNGNVWHGEICNKAKDGTLYWVDTTIVPFYNDEGQLYQFLSIRNDITKRKEAEEQLHRKDKLAAVGQLAAGVAHEIRNPLTSMKGYAEFLQIDEDKPDRREYLDIILDEIERVNHIVEEFMTLAKPPAVDLEPLSLVPVIGNVLNLLELDLKNRRIKPVFTMDAEDILIKGDGNRLKQVFLNLFKNAAEAMPDGGRLEISLRQDHGCVQIVIRDTGIGIPKEQLKKIGEPFFTTKKKGNGLGLMVSFSIIKSHGGRVSVESELNQGTVFTIEFPLLKKEGEI